MFVGSSVELWKLQQHTSILTFFADSLSLMLEKEDRMLPSHAAVASV